MKQNFLGGQNLEGTPEVITAQAALLMIGNTALMGEINNRRSFHEDVGYCAELISEQEVTETMFAIHKVASGKLVIPHLSTWHKSIASSMVKQFEEHSYMSQFDDTENL